jgi:hypothetical protein
MSSPGAQDLNKQMSELARNQISSKQNISVHSHCAFAPPDGKMFGEEQAIE